MPHTCVQLVVRMQGFVTAAIVLQTAYRLVHHASKSRALHCKLRAHALRDVFQAARLLSFIEEIGLMLHISSCNK
jgi:hypothetical protein